MNHPSRNLTDPRLSSPPIHWGVEVVERHVSHTAEQWNTRAFPPPSFDYSGPPAQLRDGPWFDYCTLAVSVLACLWPPSGSPEWSIIHRGQQLTDAPALFGALTRWVGDGPDVNLDRFAGITPAEASELFSGEGVLQLIPERADRLAAVASALHTRWEGTALNLVEEAGWNGPAVVELLAATVPGFEDEAQVDGHHLRFRKLGHLATAVMSSRSAISWTGLEAFPVYPDYMLPRLLRHLGILRYSPELAEAIDTRTLITRHSPQEVAIRWATVRAGQLLLEALHRLGTSVTGPRLDYFLWSQAVLGPDAHRMGEHHRTLTLDY